ncbi:NAD-dependent deacetylase sirtuin-2-like protein [Dinothrombium tinctorium]|uniref:NAD-dependent deacetylase sirtuin-2-like protein n=1 Tax=Dinothrombium tinctorium TaxID=1965070 RepID=A0A3S3NQF3_9ACAR|nr:NAD-dependent deacetylase sirtuin-2-like protein [Dinothrombium tinctorium]
MGLGSSKQAKESCEKVLSVPTFTNIVEYMKSGKCKNVIAMVGAGISTSAGIPDFRSPGSANICFQQNPTPFFKLAKELFPGKYDPTPSHQFLKLLNDEGMLLRLYTQNIDGLERRAGIPAEKIVEAHGTCYTSHCINYSCHAEYQLEWMKERIFNDQIPTCEKCNDIVKPDIVFFGERLPEKFFMSVDEDFDRCDLLLIIGTSLTVQPFAGLIDACPSKTPRLLINKTKCGTNSGFAMLLGMSSGLEFDSKDNYRDVFWQGNSDDGCFELAKSLGWSEKLQSLIDKSKKKD